MPDGLTVEDFAKRIRDKAPGDYDGVDDYDLTHRTLQKFPEYKEVVSFGPRERTYAAAARAGLSRDLADDFLNVTGGIESGNRHRNSVGVVLQSPPDPKTGERAVGFSQIKPSTIKPYGLDPYDEDQNIEGGLRYFSEGGEDPVARRIYYFGGPGALQRYKKTGRIPKGQDVTGTTFEKYVQATMPKASPTGDIADFSPPTEGAKQATYGVKPLETFDTVLSSQEERRFQKWKLRYAPNDTGEDYDFRGAFRAGVKPENGHWPDTFKKPNHPTFSTDSQYAVGENAAKAGRWTGDIFERQVPPPELDTSARRPRSIEDDPTKEPVGYMAEIRQRSPAFEAAFYDYVHMNTPPTSKAKTVGQAASDQSMAWSFLKIADFAQKNKDADTQTINKGLSQIGVEFLRNPQTAGSQLPKVLHEAMLASQYTPEEWETIPEKLRQQIRQYRSQVAVQRGREKQVRQLQQDVDTLGPTLQDWLPDLDWHLRMSPQEFQSLKKAQQRKVVNLVAQRVRDDQLRRQAGQQIAAPSVEEEIEMRKSIGLSRRPVTPLQIGQADTGGGLLRKMEFTDPVQAIIEHPLPEQDQPNLRMQALQQILAERQARREGPMTQALSAIALADTAKNLDADVEARYQELKHAEDERKRLVSQFTPQEKQNVIDLTKQLTAHGTGVKRGVDIGVQSVASSFIYKLAGTADAVLAGGPNAWMADWFRKQALSGELSIEEVRKLPSNKRQDVAEFVSSLAASLPEAVGAASVLGPAAGFAYLGASEAQGRSLGSGEVVKQGVKGALIGKVFDWSDLIAVSSAPRSVTETVKRLGKKSTAIGAGTAAVELGAGAEPKEAVKAALTNALLPVVMAPLHGRAKTEKGGEDARTRTPIQREGRPASEAYNAGAAGEGVIEGRGEPPSLRPRSQPPEGQVILEEAQALPRREDVTPEPIAIRPETISRLGTDPEVVAHNQRQITSEKFRETLLLESTTGNRAAVNMAIDPEGRIVEIGNIQDLSQATQDALRSGALRTARASVEYAEGYTKPRLESVAIEEAREAIPERREVTPEWSITREPDDRVTLKQKDRPSETLESFADAVKRIPELTEPSLGNLTEEIGRVRDYGNKQHPTARVFSSSPLQQQVVDALPKGSKLYNPAHPDSPEMQSGAFKLRAPNGDIWEVDLAYDHAKDASWKIIGSRMDGFAVRKTGENAAPAGGTRETSPTGDFLITGERSDITLSQFVRKRGGIVPAEMYKGELDRLRQKETGTTGLINQHNKKGNQPMTADYMMEAANEAGFRDKNGQPFTNPGDFLRAVERDVAGEKTQALTGAEVDWEAKFRERHAKEEQQFTQAEALVNALETGRGAELFDKIAEGKANEAERQELTELARKAGADVRDLNVLISEAELERAAPESISSSVPGERAEQLGFTEEGLTQETAPPPKPIDQRERLIREEQDRQAALEPERSAAHAKLAEIRRRGLTIDDYARQPDLLTGETPSAKEVEMLRAAERGPASAKEEGLNFGPGTMRAGEPLPEVKERKFGKRFVEDERIAQEIRESIGTAKYYEPISNKVTVKDAARLIDERGLPQAIKDVRDEGNNLPFRVRVAMGEETVLRLNKSYKRLKEAKSPDADFILDQATDVSEFLMDYGTRLGQGVQAFATWARLTPEGKLLTYKRAVDKAIKERQKKHPEQAQEVKEIVAEVNKQVAEASEPAPEVLTDASKTIRKAASKKVAEAKASPSTEERAKAKPKTEDTSIWQRYKDGIARNLASLTKTKGTGQKPPLQEFSDRLLQNVEGLIAKPERTKAPDDVYAKMREVVENFDKYKEAWDEAIQFIREKYKDKTPAELTEIGRRITELHSAFQTRAFDKVYNDVVKQAEINFKELARAHYDNRTQTRDQLIKDIQERLGIELSPEDAAELAAKVTQRTAAKILTARERILEAMERGKNKTAKKVKSQTEQLIEAARLGVLNEQKFYEIAAEKLGLPKYDQNVAARILQLAGEVEAAPEGMPREAKVFELNKFLAQQKGFSPGDLPLGIYYGNILSGYNTHLVNSVDTMFNVISELNGLAINNPKAAAKTYGGMLRGFADGRLDALLALTQGRMVTDGKWLEIPRLMEIAEFGKKGGVPIKVDTRRGRAMKAIAESKIAYPLNAYKYVTRLLAASDAVFFRTAKEARASLLAYRIAQAEGLKGDLLESRVRQILSMDREADFAAQAWREGFIGVEAKVRTKELRDMVRDKDLSADAAEFAGEATYNHKPHGALGYASEALGKWAEEYKALKLFVPFTRIVANVTNRGLNYTPWGLKRAFFGFSGEGPLTPEARRLMITRSVLGIVGINTLAALQAADYIQIHGNGPSDREKRRQLQQAGWRPYTLQIGDTYISYMYTPLALGLAVTGNMSDSQRYHELEQKDAATRAAYAVARLGSTIFSQSFLSGLSRLFNALSEEPSRSVTAVKQILGSTTAAATTPALVRDMYRLFDNKAYQANTLMEDLIRNTPFAVTGIPGVKEPLKPQLNAFGEPVRVQRQRFFDVMSSDPAWRFVTEKGLRVPVPSKTTELAKGERITPDEYYNLLLKTGPRLKQWITENQKMLGEMKEQDAQEEISKASAAITKDELERLREAKGMVRKRVITPPTELTNPTDKRRSMRPRRSREWQYPSERREERQRRYNVQAQ